MLKQDRKHSVKDCESKPNWFRDSDHIPIWAEILTNMKRCEPKEEIAKAKKYHKPTKEELKEYNAKIRTVLEEKKQERKPAEERETEGMGNAFTIEE